MKALVTGASGFLGRRVVKALLARAIEVRAVVRPGADLKPLDWATSVEVFRADLCNSRELARAFESVDVVVHLAAVASGGEDAPFARTVVGTERLLDAMATSACRRLVLCSTFSVYDFRSTRGVLDEDSPLHHAPDVYACDGYAISKWRQERMTRRFADTHGWDLTVLRPGFIWGRDRAYLAALGKQFGRHHLVIGPLTRMPMTHVENCADVFALAATDPRARGQTLNVLDGPGERIWTYLSDYMRGRGERGWRVPVPYWVAASTARLAYATAFRRATKPPSILIPGRLQSRFKPLRFENRRLRETLGWTPPLDYRQCLARTYGPQPDATAQSIDRRCEHAREISDDQKLCA
jgi:2-alkyl-3-oxoalkanoate reductase